MSILAHPSVARNAAAAAEVQGYSDSLIETATRYREAAVLFAALELGLFRRLAERAGDPPDVESLANAAGWRELPLRLLLETLAAMGVVARVAGGRYTVAAQVSELLEAERMDEWLLSNKRQNQIWLELPEMIRGTYQGEGFYETLVETPLMGNYLQSIGQTNAEAASATARLIRQRRPDLCDSLDVGAGHGLFSQRILESYPQARATLFDLPHSLDVGRANLNEAGLAERCEFVYGDARALNLDVQFDLVMLNDLLHYFDRASKAELLDLACRHVRAGGLLAVCKIAFDEKDPAPAFDPAMISLRFHINTQSGYLEGDGELAALFADAGLSPVECLRLSTFKTLLLGRVAA